MACCVALAFIVYVFRDRWMKFLRLFGLGRDLEGDRILVRGPTVSKG